MIELIIKGYLTILLPVAFVALSLFAIGFYWIIVTILSSRKNELKENSLKELISQFKEHDQAATIFSQQDLTAIAGEDVYATQLDLARACIELDKKTMAKEILNSVVANGKLLQQQEAQHLLNTL